MRHLTILIVAAACLFSLGAAGDAPQSKPARSALDDYSTAKSKLDADYHAKLAGLTKSLLTRLTAAKAGAMKANDLPEANAIQSEIDRAQAALEATNPAIKRPELEGTFIVSYSNGNKSQYIISGGKVSAEHNTGTLEWKDGVYLITFDSGRIERITQGSDGWKVEHFRSIQAMKSGELLTSGTMVAKR